MVVKYSKKFPYAPYLNEDIGFEMEIPDDGDPMAELVTLKHMAERFHKEGNPHLYGTNAISIPQGPYQPMQDYDPKKADTESIIYDCNTKEELEKQKSNAEKYGLMELWSNKLNELK